MLNRPVLARFALWFSASLVLLCLFAATAFAQPTPAPAPVAGLSTATIIIALLSILVGYIGQAVTSGSLFGLAPVPRSIVPYLTLLGTFLAAGVTSIASASTTNGDAWVRALLAGLTALTGTAVGVTAHQHINAGKTLVVGFLLCAFVSSGPVACTPAQVAALNADAAEAAAILAGLNPIACAIVDTVDPANAAGICQVMTDVTTGATVLVPIFGTLTALTTVVVAKPPNAAVTAAVPLVHVSRAKGVSR